MNYYQFFIMHAKTNNTRQLQSNNDSPEWTSNSPVRVLGLHGF